MAAYWIGAHEINNLAKFEDYLAQVVPMISRYGGRYLTRPGTHTILESSPWKPNRVVIVEFPSRDSLNAWYQSAEYQPLIKLRQESATDLLIAVDGV